jgi:hypothetical protein
MALSAVANWRLALVASMIAAAIAATRMRYAGLVTLALLALVLALASAGLSAGSDTGSRHMRGPRCTCCAMRPGRALCPRVGEVRLSRRGRAARHEEPQAPACVTHRRPRRWVARGLAARRLKTDGTSCLHRDGDLKHQALSASL